ncbi:helix-turn-helix domain-containing protein [Pedobacter antarcticus]|uniref:helix-turn-helix domain-containing protein n=1 Tax=Pedobacter antarcticus TaxID=34086 RepID=UPI001C59C330|nr:helix-turn-helix transcriptional regulator [Pedobacter antarcticus]
MEDIYWHEIVMGIIIIILIFICILLNRRRIKLQSELYNINNLPVYTVSRRVNRESKPALASLIKNKRSDQKRKPATNPQSEQFLSDFNLVINTHLGNDQLNIDFIAQQMSISRIQLYRKTKGLIDCTVNDYILRERLNKAAALLTDSQASITEITFQVGFSSPAYFSTVFKARYSTTPSEFRKKTVDHA